MKGDATENPIEDSMMNESAKALRHENKNKRGKRVTLSDSSGRNKRSGGGSINKDGIERGRDETHDPTYPHLVKAKSFKNALNIAPTEFIESFREIDLEKHTWFFSALERVDDFVSHDDAIHDVVTFHVALLF